jgi:hypothetical protein
MYVYVCTYIAHLLHKPVHRNATLRSSLLPTAADCEQ